jgi:hypothetical protein
MLGADTSEEGGGPMRLNGTRLKYTIVTTLIADVAHLHDRGVRVGESALPISGLEGSRGSGSTVGEPPCQ